MGLPSNSLGGGADANQVLTTIFAGSRNRFNEKDKPWSTGGKLPNNEQIQALGKQLLVERLANAIQSIPQQTYHSKFD